MNVIGLAYIRLIHKATLVIFDKKSKMIINNIFYDHSQTY